MQRSWITSKASLVRIPWDHFRARTKEFIQVLKQFPEIGVLELRDKNIRAFQLSKQTRIYYRVMGERITILTFFDSKWDPRKKPR